MLTWILPLVLAASTPTRTVLVLDLSVRKGVSVDVASTLSELMAIEVRKVALGQRIYSTADIKSLMGFKKQQAIMGCEDSSCLAELGGALGAQEIVTGSLSIIADDYVLVLRRMDVAKATVIEETTDNIPTNAAGRLQPVVTAAIDRLWQKAVAPVVTASVATTEPKHRSLALPIALGVAAVAVAAVSVIGWAQVWSFEGLKGPTPVTLAAATSAQSAAKWGEPVGIVGMIAAVGLAGGAVIAW